MHPTIPWAIAAFISVAWVLTWWLDNRDRKYVVVLEPGSSGVLHAAYVYNTRAAARAHWKRSPPEVGAKIYAAIHPR